jgi:hypothetical protein
MESTVVTSLEDAFNAYEVGIQNPGRAANAIFVKINHSVEGECGAAQTNYA